MSITTNDREILRELGRRFAEVASLPVHAEKRDLWKALNRSAMRRPMVVIDQLPWNELNTDGELDCFVADRFWRGIESSLRQTLYKWEHFPVDMVIEPFITIPKAIFNSGYGPVTLETTLPSDERNAVVSHRYVNQLREPEDIEKIHDMRIVHNDEESRRRMEEAAEIFEGIIPVRQSGGMQFHLGIWDTLSTLMGVETIYFDLLDRPEFILAILERMTQSLLAGIRQVNEQAISDDAANVCHCSYIYTDELLPDFGAGRGSVTGNSWAFGLAQLFTSVSPAVTEEFEIPYISRLAEHFGGIYYGCCDRLDDRLDAVKRIPNVKKVSCSPWSNRDAFAERIGNTLIMSAKPTPAVLAETVFDTSIAHKDLEHTVNAATRNGVNLELILKDISTVKYEPARLTAWAELAMSVVNG